MSQLDQMAAQLAKIRRLRGVPVTLIWGEQTQHIEQAVMAAASRRAQTDETTLFIGYQRWLIAVADFALNGVPVKPQANMVLERNVGGIIERFELWHADGNDVANFTDRSTQTQWSIHSRLIRRTMP